MINPAQIPDEVVEAGAMVLHDHVEIFDDLPWDDLSAADQEAYLDEARAAFLAMLGAWPGMSQLAENDSASIREMAALILPLTQQASDE